jgi:hypothetical protein
MSDAGKGLVQTDDVQDGVHRRARFAGNVLREIYRISLADGSALDVATGKKVAK